MLFDLVLTATQTGPERTHTQKNAFFCPAENPKKLHSKTFPINRSPIVVAKTFSSLPRAAFPGRCQAVPPPLPLPPAAVAAAEVTEMQ